MAVRRALKDRRIGQVVISTVEIRRKVKELGRQISKDYRGSTLLLIGILRGSTVFLADLMRAITVPTEIDFMAITSYGRQSKEVHITKDLDESIAGKDVLIVEDIVDTGLTLSYIMPILRARGPRSLKICTLLDRSFMRIVPLPIAYRGFELPDIFVVGYGLDYCQLYRNLPAIFRYEVEV